MWFPGWRAYAQARHIQTRRVYLSLGDREARTKNPVMAAVGENLRRQDALLAADPGCLAHTLVWNPGNHFQDSERRTAAGFVWLLEGETDVIAKMANVAAVLHETFGFWWTGFYRVAEDELVLGPFQGPVACMHIPFGKGVCGTAWKRNETVVVPDVEQFPGHIACSSASRSEIVVPVHGPDGAVTAVLDIDSDRLATFDEEDRVWLEKIVTWL